MKRVREAAIAMATLGVCLHAACSLAGMESAKLARGVAGGSSVRYFHGGLGAGAALATRAGGALAWERRYEPYGAALGAIDLADEPHAGLGKPVDAATG